ncbi:Prefoldin [Apiospora sp. TS-2023a]
MAEVQAKLQALSEDYQKLQQELQASVQSRQKLQAQRTENEFDRLKEGESIYKLVGPVLLKQDKVEAESTVKGRLEFIGKEVERTEQQIREVQEKIEKKKTEIIQLQSSAQAAAGAAPSQVAAKG